MDLQQQLTALQRRIESLEKDIERSRHVARLSTEAQFIASQQGLDWWKLTTKNSPPAAFLRTKLVKRLCVLGWSHSKIATALGVSNRTVDRCCGRC